MEVGFHVEATGEEIAQQKWILDVKNYRFGYLHQNSLQKTSLKHLWRENKPTQNRSELFSARCFQSSHVEASEKRLEFCLFSTQIWDGLKQGKCLFWVFLIDFNGLNRFVNNIHIFTQILVNKKLFNLLIGRIVVKSEALSYKVVQDYAFIYLGYVFDLNQFDNNLFDDLLEYFSTLTLLNYMTHQNFESLAGKFNNFRLIRLIVNVEIDLVFIQGVENLSDLVKDQFWRLSIMVNQRRDDAV